MSTPDEDGKRLNYLERLVMGLETSIEDMRARVPLYPKEDIERRYAEKFLASMEENLVKARAELAELEKKLAALDEEE